MIKSINKLFMLVISAAVLSSCARDLSSHAYSASQVGEASMTYSGVIQSIREVCVDGSDQLDENQLGITAGGITGGVLGNAIGRGNLFPTALGAVAGALTGSLVEKKLKRQMAYEYIVALNDGALLTVVQGKDQPMAIGEPVYVHISPAGRSRISPQYHY